MSINMACLNRRSSPLGQVIPSVNEGIGDIALPNQFNLIDLCIQTAKIATVLSLSLSDYNALGQDRYDIELPHLQTIDQNNVDLTSGLTVFTFEDQSMTGVEKFSHTISSFNYANPYITSGSNTGKTDGFYDIFDVQDNFRSGLSMDAGSPGSHSGQEMRLVNGSYVYWSTMVVSYQGTSEVFWAYGQNDKAYSPIPTGYIFDSKSKDGGKLEYLGSSIFRYTDKLGNIMTINQSIAIDTVSFGRIIWPVTNYKKINGLQTQVNYSGNRISSVVRSDGFAFVYRRDSSSKLIGVISVNLAQSYCDLTVASCSAAANSKESHLDWAAGSLIIKDPSNHGIKYIFDNYNRVSSIYDVAQLSTPLISYTYCNREQPLNCAYSTGGVVTNFPDKVMIALALGKSYSYLFSVIDGGRFQSYLRSDGAHPNSGSFRDFDSGLGGRVTQLSNPDGSTYYLGDENRINSVVIDGRSTGFTYDNRGNVTQKSYVPNDGGQILYENAGYDATCSNIVTCNRPNWYEDRKGNRTNITYDPVHGGILTVTAPAVNGISAQRRYTYIQRYPRTLTSSGGSIQASLPVWLVASESFCRTSSWNGSSCVAGAADEVRTDYDYGPDSGGNNLWLRGKVVTNGSTSIRTCYGYDAWGNVIWETTPKAGLSSCW